MFQKAPELKHMSTMLYVRSMDNCEFSMFEMLEFFLCIQHYIQGNQRIFPSTMVHVSPFSKVFDFYISRSPQVKGIVTDNIHVQGMHIELKVKIRKK